MSPHVLIEASMSASATAPHPTRLHIVRSGLIIVLYDRPAMNKFWQCEEASACTLDPDGAPLACDRGLMFSNGPAVLVDFASCRRRRRPKVKATLPLTLQLRKMPLSLGINALLSTL